MSNTSIVDSWLKSFRYFTPNKVLKLAQKVINKAHNHWSSTLHHFMLLSLIAAPVSYALHIAGIFSFSDICGKFLLEQVPVCGLFMMSGMMAMTGHKPRISSYLSINALCALGFSFITVTGWFGFILPATMALKAGPFSINALATLIVGSLLVRPPMLFATIYCLKGMNPVASVIKGIKTNIFHLPLTTGLLSILMLTILAPFNLPTVAASNPVAQLCNYIATPCCQQLPYTCCLGTILIFGLVFMASLYAVSLYATVSEEIDR